MTNKYDGSKCESILAPVGAMLDADRYDRKPLGVCRGKSACVVTLGVGMCEWGGKKLLNGAVRHYVHLSHVQD